MKFLPIAIALTLLPIPTMAQQVILPEAVYIEYADKVFKDLSPDNPIYNAKTNREKIEDGKFACSYIKSSPIKSYLKSRIYESFNRFPDSQEQFDHHLKYHQFILNSAITTLCPQLKEEYKDVSDRIIKEGLEWIIQP